MQLQTNLLNSTILMARLFVLFLILMSIGCGVSEQPIRIQPGETTADAVERVAKTLPAERAEEFSKAAAVVILSGAFSSKSLDGMADSSRNAIDGKTPSQIIAESKRLYESVPQK